MAHWPGTVRPQTATPGGATMQEKAKVAGCPSASGSRN